MIRKLLKLALSAARHEVARWKNPAPPEPAPVVVPADRWRNSRWSSSAYHVEVLGSSVCPDCDEVKAVGSYRCKACHAKAVTA